MYCTTLACILERTCLSLYCTAQSMNPATSTLSSCRVLHGETLTSCTQMLPVSKCAFPLWRNNAIEAVQATIEIAAAAVDMPLTTLLHCSPETPITVVSSPGPCGVIELNCCLRHAFIIRGVSRHLPVHLAFTEDVAFISSAPPQGIPEAELIPGCFPFRTKSSMESSNGGLLGTPFRVVNLRLRISLPHKLGLKWRCQMGSSVRWGNACLLAPACSNYHVLFTVMDQTRTAMICLLG